MHETANQSATATGNQTGNLVAFLNDFTASITAQAQKLINQPSSYVQLGIIGIILAVSFLIAFIYGKRVSALVSQTETHNGIKAFALNARGISAPAAAVLFTLVAANAGQLVQEKVLVLDFALNFFVIWLLWASIRSFVGSPIIRTIANWILLPTAILIEFNEFSNVVAVLESVGFTLGKVEITAYTIVKALVFFSVVFWIGRLFSDFISGYIRGKDNLNISTKELLVKLFDIGLYVILFIVTIDLIGIDLTALTVFSGALGVGLGFGLQKIASNFISGIILLSERSITLGNLVEMDNGVFGHMRRLGARASIIETLDGQEVMVPNEDFITSRVSNYTHTSNAGRISIPVGVSYDSDLKKAHKLILSAAEEYDGISQDPGHKPECFLRQFNDNSVDFLLVFWMDNVLEGRWRAQSDVMFAVWDKLKEGGIEIPFPQRTLHLKSGFENLPSPERQDTENTDNEKSSDPPDQPHDKNEAA